MDAMKTHVAALVDNATPIPAAYKTLLDTYILPALLHYSLCRAVPIMKFKHAAKGLMVKNSENSQQADTIDMEKMEDRWRNIAMIYAKRMYDYLIWNSSTYPEFIASSSSTYKIYPTRDGIECPIYLEGLNYEPES